MDDTVFGIDKGVIKAIGLVILIVGGLTTFFLSEYVAAIILGSVYQISNNGTTSTDTAVTDESFTANNVTQQVLANSPILGGTLVIGNASGNKFAIGNFTIINANSSILLNSPSDVTNGTTLFANYTYRTTTFTGLPITSDTKTFLGTAEDDFVTTFTQLNTAIKFIAALITVVAVILVFASFLPDKGKKGKYMDY